MYYNFLLILIFVSTGMTTSATRAAFQLCPDHAIHNMCSRFHSWVAEAMGVKFLAQGNNSCRRETNHPVFPTLLHAQQLAIHAHDLMIIDKY